MRISIVCNKQRLQDIAAKYDPRAVFQRLQPGYFKLTHAQRRILIRAGKYKAGIYI